MNKYDSFVKFWEADVRGFWTREKGPQNSTCWWPPEVRMRQMKFRLERRWARAACALSKKKSPCLHPWPLATILSWFCSWATSGSRHGGLDTLLEAIHIMMSYGPQNCWMQAGEVEVSIQGIQSFNIARTQLEGAPAQLCQHQLGSLGTHLTSPLGRCQMFGEPAWFRLTAFLSMST